jgi:hypothetical protein
MQMIKEYLNQPYPKAIYRWKIVISISIFIGLFMLVFQPFGFSEYKGNKTIIGAGFGLVTLVTLIFDLSIIKLFFKNWFDKKEWTVKKQIIWQIWILFTIGVANSIYASCLNWSWSFYIFLFFQGYTVAIGIIPIVVVTVIQQNRLLTENLKSAQEFNNSLHPKDEMPGSEIVSLLADNEKDRFELELSQLLYIESSGNYIEVFYTKDKLLKSILLRSTLKRTELQLEQHSAVLKCHRAFLINVNKITHVKGNSQGLRLALKYTDTEIPVSRNFSKNLKDKLNSLT